MGSDPHSAIAFIVVIWKNERVTLVCINFFIFSSIALRRSDLRGKGEAENRPFVLETEK